MRDTHKAETGEHALGRVVAVGHDEETGDDAVRCDDDVCAAARRFFLSRGRDGDGDAAGRHATRVEREGERTARKNE